MVSIPSLRIVDQMCVVFEGLTMEGILKNWSKIKLVIMKDWSENIDALFHLFGKVRDEWMDKDLTTWTGANRSEALSYGQSIYTQMTPILLLVCGSMNIYSQ
ncbi:hypothetical protein CICLE_v10013186mg [Citrus x clementina]|uniref:Uncharacterized protein n=2 Tax=Citrus clementina TaxID=85681 RepID=V4S2D6_CITCL|nr:hypothetical protein CICLE_v10013186mg [Citrus x clementina]